MSKDQEHSRLSLRLKNRMSGDLSYKKYVNKEHALTTGAQTRVPSSPERATTVCRAGGQLPIPASSFPHKPSPKDTTVSQQVDQWVGAVGTQREGPTKVECCEAALGAPSPGGASQGCACMCVCECTRALECCWTRRDQPGVTSRTRSR